MFKSKQNQISGKIHFKWEEVKWRKVSARTTHNILKFLYKAEKKKTDTQYKDHLLKNSLSLQQNIVIQIFSVK